MLQIIFFLLKALVQHHFYDQISFYFKRLTYSFHNNLISRYNRFYFDDLPVRMRLKFLKIRSNERQTLTTMLDEVIRLRR